MRLTDCAGTWTGTNGFRMMPGDPLAEAGATLTATPAAGGHLVALAYSWRHPGDGPQDGLLVAGVGDDGAPVAMWGDSWHQQPAPMSLSGAHPPDGPLELEAGYADGWRWRIVLEAAGPALRLRMDNVVPGGHATAEVPAGPYPVMVMDLRRV